MARAHRSPRVTVASYVASIDAPALGGAQEPVDPGPVVLVEVGGQIDHGSQFASVAQHAVISLEQLPGPS